MTEAQEAVEAPKVRKSWGAAVFRAGAISNWLVTLPAILAPEQSAEMLGLDHMKYFYLLRIWSGMAFLWGVMFWEIARDLDSHKAMIKYSWIEKSVTTASVAIAYFGYEEVGLRVLIMILFTDVIWIFLFFYYDWRTACNPLPHSVLADARRTLGLST